MIQVSNLFDPNH